MESQPFSVVAAMVRCKTKLMLMASEKGRVFHHRAFALKYAHGGLFAKC